MNPVLSVDYNSRQKIKAVNRRLSDQFGGLVTAGSKAQTEGKLAKQSGWPFHYSCKQHSRASASQRCNFKHSLQIKPASWRRTGLMKLIDCYSSPFPRLFRLSKDTLSCFFSRSLYYTGSVIIYILKNLRIIIFCRVCSTRSQDNCVPVLGHAVTTDKSLSSLKLSFFICTMRVGLYLLYYVIFCMFCLWRRNFFKMPKLKMIKNLRHWKLLVWKLLTVNHFIWCCTYFITQTWSW